jgi:hypothetical protein
VGFELSYSDYDELLQHPKFLLVGGLGSIYKESLKENAAEHTDQKRRA